MKDTRPVPRWETVLLKRRNLDRVVVVNQLVEEPERELHRRQQDQE